MSFTTSDHIGNFAELLARTDLSRPVVGRYRRPLFRATPLGDKYPAVDLIVDVLGPDDVAQGFFFAQVKGTAQPIRVDGRLPITVDVARYNRLGRIPAPTYILGVDVVAESSYLVAAHRPRRMPVSSMATAFRLGDATVKIELYREVMTFWQTNKAVLQRTRFNDG